MFDIINKRFDIEGFRTYVEALFLSGWNPSLIVVHNTASPSLAQRPDGLTKQHITNLQRYYSEERGWGGGPHAFVTDRDIIVFNPLTKPGVHSPSWNRQAWGIELLGNFEMEDPLTGRGAKVVANAVGVVSALLAKLGKAPSNTSLKFHFEDPLTNHACPGKLLTKPYFLSLLSQPAKPSTWSVVGPDGETVREGLPPGDGGTGLVRAVAESLGATVQVEGKVIRLVKGGA